MPHRPQVAVITRTKDRNLLLRRAIESVLNQTENNWVHVIVNDGGNAASVDQVLEPYQERYQGRLTIIHHEHSKGMEAASNAGIQASDSKYILIHDDDDSLEPIFLERCINELSHCRFPSVKGVVTHITQIFEKIENDKVTEVKRVDFDPDLTAISLPLISEINRFLPISFLFERSVFEKVGFFDESLPVIGDWEFNIRFLMHFDIIVIKENLANYYIRTNSPPKYSNTVTVGKDAHLFHRSLIINKHIRNDLQSGKITQGMLLAYGDYFLRIGHNLWRFNQFIEKLKSLALVKWIRKIVGK